MIWKRMNNTEAKKIVEGIEKNSEEAFNTLLEGWKEGKFSDEVDAEYRVIRDKIFAEYSKCKNKSGYEIDLRVGLALYELLLKDEFKLNPIYANDDDIWRYLSVRVFLDITYLREPSNVRYSWGISGILNQNSVNSEFVNRRPKNLRSFFTFFIFTTAQTFLQDRICLATSKSRKFQSFFIAKKFYCFSDSWDSDILANIVFVIRYQNKFA